MNDQTLKLLEKALNAAPDDWETRAHLVEHYVGAGALERAEALLHAAPRDGATEEEILCQARAEVVLAPEKAHARLEALLAQNRACAPAFLLLAKVFRRRGLKEEARKKYGAATVIDETLHDAELEQWLGGGAPAKAESAAPAEASEGGLSAVSLTGSDVEAAVRDALPAESSPRRITFADIGGMEEVIERIRMNIIYPFKNPEAFQRFKKRAGGGILMYGPPGCGKTHIARATAGECGATFISIAITDILSKWLGESERHLHEIFELARRRAPTVLFIDEVDAIGMSRADSGPYIASLVNTLLTEMDGVEGGNESLMVLAATNTPWRIDAALRRPGRFDRVLFVPPPDLPARAAILQICLCELPVESLNIEALARGTERFSGADLRAVVERASEQAIMEEMRTGRAGKITQKMLLEAARGTKRSTIDWLETARSYATYANRAGLYDELVEYFEK